MLKHGEIGVSLHEQSLEYGWWKCESGAARELVRRYRQKLLLLFKLFLLERKVLFFKSPVVELSGRIGAYTPCYFDKIIPPR
jgi:hypothetical protein